jgi:toxin-antitoxin system PIN domain toxin
VILVDVNLLLYAVITAFPQHPAAHSWWRDVLNGSTEVSLAVPTIFGFLRLATDRRILRSPLPVQEAIGYVRQWLDRPRVRLLLPGPRHLDLAFGLLADAGTAGNLTTDVQLAALAIENQAELHSNDTDFGRFPGLRWVNPLRGAG